MWPLVLFKLKTILTSYSLYITILVFTGLIFIYPRESEPLYVMFNIINSIIVIVSFSIFGHWVIELRKSTIFKRLGSANISKTDAIVAFSISQFILILGVIAYLAIVVIIMKTSGWFINDSSTNSSIPISTSGIAYSTFILIIISISISLLFSTIFKSITLYNVFSSIYTLAYILVSIYYSKTMFNFATTGGQAEKDLYNILTIVSYLIPSMYVKHLINASLFSVNILNDALNISMWSFTEGYYLVFPKLSSSNLTFPIKIEPWQASLDLFLPPIISIGASITSVWRFTWDTSR